MPLDLWCPASVLLSGTMYPHGTSAVIIQDGAERIEPPNLSSKQILPTPIYVWRSRTITYSDTNLGSRISSRMTTIRNTRSPWPPSLTRFHITALMMKTLLNISRIAKVVDMINSSKLPGRHTSPNVVPYGREYDVTQQGLPVTASMPRISSLMPIPNHPGRICRTVIMTGMTTIPSQQTGERMYN